ncbi:phospholipid/cholesterol/gamma-HCH transport system substrate-binding protein [Amycolatopsis arida]|uniref:Phospholipid/cholesterol/gamma-HCH transport system substrate-binding protein n=1 Tax=Amycolatopsis arida TaxID=587909 RepID=A0A1I6A456_9PSEU|nr:MCE family protein [Amycolatopsis arida]TDX88630.1 phospholipid/cholesterol/gamma-HCH transport system substrate-binding protein [Amycolatopsis arida]SFQ63428.1 phospholipid/cholesterol/gamma-HCH transport system substrate-binding protein [Amycolatopsis arida]
MLIRKTKWQLVAFAVIAVVSVVYALIRFTDVERVFGAGGYTVRLQLDESGGIFTNAEVTYRGYNIGRVGDLRLTARGLEADLHIEPDTPPVPADLRAVVANRSAVGEQFVDLRPVTASGPFLDEGDVIPAEKTTTPIRTDEVLADLDGLAASVPTEALRTVVDESYDAFRGTGDDLQVLIDTARDFTSTAREYLPQTVTLLDSGGQVLRTQNELAGSMRSFSADLNRLSETLRDSDADLRHLIAVTPEVSRQVSEVLAETGPGLGALVANLLTTANVMVTRLDGLEQVFVTYPLLSVGAQTVAPGDGTAHLGLALNMFDPPPCTKGYPRAEAQIAGQHGYRPGNETTPRQPDENAYCAEPQGSPIAVRGAQNAPYHGVPVSPTPEQVEANRNRPAEELASLRGVPGPAGGPGLSLTTLRDLLALPH